ncbi:MAG: hypothetical protein OXF61_11475 [Acidimicrobiaceae bacterium]|nr:hypothetical protein [Acidimicrobiaceae bacterium]
MFARGQPRVGAYFFIAFQGEPLPRSGSGKVLKSVLREPYWEGHYRAIN